MKKLNISEYVKLLRAEKQMSTRAFGKAYNISKAQVSKYEIGKVDNPSLICSIHFCKVFNIPLIEFSEKFRCSEEVQKLLNSYEDFSNIKHTKSIDKEISRFIKTLNFYKKEIK